VTRGLTSRHIQFIALGGAIGSGLFLGSGRGIAVAGPAVLAAYVVSGVIMYFIARALGELTVNDPRDGSFTGYANDYIGPWCGFVTGWSYWLSWILVGMADLTAVSAFLHFWWPDLPQWLSVLVGLSGLYAINRLGVRLFGELEFWLAIVKVLAVSGLIVAGIVIIGFHLTVGGTTPHLANLWEHGGWFPTGIKGFLAVLPITFFAFGGTELIGLTAREAEDPDRAVPRAINSVIARIFIFYVGSITVIMALFPWDGLDARQSPFVLVFDKIGLPAAAGLINFVVLTAVLSSCNSGLFATARVLTALSGQGQAPKSWAEHDKRGIPAKGLSVSAGAMLGGVGLNYFAPDDAFGYLLEAAILLLMWAWMVSVVCHWRFRRLKGDAPTKFRLPMFPLVNILIIAFILIIIGLMLTVLGMQVPVLLAVAWFGLLLAAYRLIKPQPHL
jgi:AAT family amino acid transporter/D-serine/D-alanine/glycine transporter